MTHALAKTLICALLTAGLGCASAPADKTDVRKVEGHYRADNFGEIRFGKGQSASDDPSEFDLSGTGHIGLWENGACRT